MSIQKSKQQIMASRKSIFSWAGLAKLSGVPYHFFTQNKIEDEQKEAIKTVIEKGTSDLLGGSYKVIETFSIQIDEEHNTNYDSGIDSQII